MDVDRYEVAVLGLGGVGAAAFQSLACRGVNVVGIDRFDSIHEHGSSHGQSRIFRIAYFEHPDYVPLAVFSQERWQGLEERSSKRIFIETGGVWVGPESGCHVRESRLAADHHGLDYELLDPDESMRRWPALRVPRQQICFHEPDAGIICPEHAIEAFLAEGCAEGGRIMRGNSIERIELEEDGVVVQLGNQWIRARRIVMALGSWTKAHLDALDLRPRLNIDLEPQRQLLGWTRPRQPELLGEERFPVWLFADNEDSIQYGFPICHDLPGPGGVKVARHCPGEVCDPDAIRRTVDETDERFVLEGLQERIPAAFGPLHSLKTCLYTMSTDGHFILDHHPADDRIVIAGGFSGHGFKFCPALGEALADLVLEGGSGLPVDFLGLGRFNTER
ncbi:MAG: N-methyltryptophan oxidase [Planctomycetes bacterium TMED75]|nr:N-methyl-L-tryptophan oxidase [Planctomycetaceae bacterium]OUU96941.1 MAG: N-methyltryptophan oxidase [Planctomycetes bacterium TMED75]